MWRVDPTLFLYSTGQDARAESLRKSGYPVSEGPTSSVTTQNNATITATDSAVEKKGAMAETGGKAREPETTPTNSIGGGVAKTPPSLEKPDPGSTGVDIASESPQPESPPTTLNSAGEGVVGQTELLPSSEGGVANGNVEPGGVSTVTS